MTLTAPPVVAAHSSVGSRVALMAVRFVVRMFSSEEWAGVGQGRKGVEGEPEGSLYECAVPITSVAQEILALAQRRTRAEAAAPRGLSISYNQPER